MLGNQCPTFEVPVTLHQGATLQKVGVPQAVVNVDNATAVLVLVNLPASISQKDLIVMLISALGVKSMASG